MKPARGLLCAFVLMAGLVSAVQGQSSPPKWQVEFKAAEKEVESGNLEKAVRHYEAGLESGRSERQRSPRGASAGAEEMSVEAEARASLAVASLKGELSLKPGNKRDKGDPKASFNKAIWLAKPYPSLYFRARNELAVFLLQAGRLGEAEKLLREMRAEAEEQEPSAFSRYEYNFAQMLLLVKLKNGEDSLEDALPHYISSFNADPGFRPAADALFSVARKTSVPALGVELIWVLAGRSLQRSDTISATEYLRTGLARADWQEEESFSDLLDMLMHLFIAIDLDAAGFDSEWSEIVEAIPQSPLLSASLRAQSIVRAYEGDLRPCLDPLDAVERYAPWGAQSPDDFRLFSAFLTMIADQQFKAGDTGSALDYYLIATCLDSESRRARLHFANLFREKQDLWPDFRDRKASPEIYVSLATGFIDLGEDQSASAAFLGAAQASASSYEIDRYIRRAIFWAPDQRQALLETQDDLIARLATNLEQITVTEGDVPATRITLASLEGVPNSRGSLSLSSLVAPNALAAHLSLTDSQGGQGETPSFAGASPRNNVLSVDNIVIEGPPEAETQSSYYGIDALDSLDVLGGGADTSLASNGLHLNLVTKNPADQWAGSASYLAIPEASQIELSLSRINFAPGQAIAETDRLRSNEEYSVQAGGPLRREKLWAWASHGQSAVGASSLGGQGFSSRLSDTALKLNASLFGPGQLSLSFNRGGRRDDGLGAGLTRAPETTFDRDIENEAWRVDYGFDTKVWTLSTQYSRTEASQEPLSRPEADIVLGPDGVWRGAFRQDRSSSNASQWQASGTYLSSGARWGLKAGGSLREVESLARTSFGPRESLFIAGPNLGADFDVARFYRTGRMGVDTTQAALWLQNTVRVRRFTFDLGLRHDLQEAENQEASAAASTVLPELLTAVQAGRGAGRISWDALSPRLGIVYGLKHDTLLRATYSRFASPIQLEYVQRTSAAAPSYVQFAFDDDDGNGILDPAEHGSLRLLTSSGIDPERPQAGNANVTAGDLKPEITSEFILGVETGSRDTRLDLSATWRRVSQILELRTFVREGGQVRLSTRDDFIPAGSVGVTLPDGSRSSADLFTLRPGITYTGGQLLTNGDREQEYFGLKLNLSTPLGSRGQVRGILAYESSRWEIGPRFRLFDDPTNVAQNPEQSSVSRADDDGDAVAVQPSKTADPRSPFLSSKWSANLNGTFELPFKVLLGANVNFHQGYGLPYFATVLPADGRERDVQVTRRSDSFRLPDLYIVDLKLQRTYKVGGLATTLSLESFNVLNRGTTLQRIQQLNGPQPDYLAKTLNPRTLRLGLRLSWEP